MQARRWAPILFGVAVFVVFVILGVAVFSVSWVRDHMEFETASAREAGAAFDELRQRFAGKAPLLEMQGTVVTQRNPPPPDGARTTLSTLHVMAWTERDSRMVRVEVPFWLIRIKETPIRFGTYATGLDDLRISLTAGDLERYGPGIIIDATRGGERAMLWVN